MSSTSRLQLLTFDGERLAGGGNLRRIHSASGATYLVASPRGTLPDLSRLGELPTDDQIERALVHQEKHALCRVGDVTRGR